MSTIVIDIVARLLIGAFLFCSWFYIVYHPTANDAAILVFIQTSLGALFGHSWASYQPKQGNAS